MMDKDLIQYMRGVPRRGREVIEYLKSQGGENVASLMGDDDALFYFITPSGEIHAALTNSALGEVVIAYGNEEFLTEDDSEEPQKEGWWTTFKPFGKILVRDGLNEKWMPEFFCGVDEEGVFYPSISFIGVGCQYRYAVPYTKETEHLVWTENPAPERYVLRR